ncbi:protein kinase domain-containing protein [Bradyrhizobium sp. ERR14]|uniref:protein kinase domain-containing protein n=1 Tax=Bradyrhizobium sp. ERR14 TaxID=2663837 RepID=UPI00161115B4|nr:protein kinase [Bradyrhizobium sp. ERR14]MBB4397008.1 serine/threonine protein kinase [Bradyrhizobium sp. ERR14]
MDKTRAKRMAFELQGRTVGGWEIGRYLGNGFSAVVLSAQKSGRSAAIKVIDPEMVERSGVDRQLARILREKELAGHGHPNLIEILDGGQCNETQKLFVVMELVSSKTLGQVRNKLPRKSIGSVISQLASAARYLETRGIAHRDIKPDNATISADYASVKLLDLGVIYPPSDPTGPSAGTGDQFVGTARYSSPEFLYREEEDTIEAWRAVTFYQLGATLYDLLMKRPIFDDFKQPTARLYQAVREHTPVIDCDDVEPWLVDLARKCLHKDWRVRKELVAWKDFEGPSKPTETGAEVRQRLAKRLGNVQLPGTPNLTSKSGARPSRRLLNQLSGAIATIAREVCRQGEVYPAVELSAEIDGDHAVVCLCAGPSEAHELAGVLHVKLTIDALDTQATLVRVLGDARLGEKPIGDDQCTLFTGASSAPDLKERIDVYLHAALEKALGTGEPPAAGLSIRPDIKEI